MHNKDFITQGKSDWKRMVENAQPTLEQIHEVIPGNNVTKSFGDRFFQCLKLISPVAEKFKNFEKKIPTMQDGSTFLHSDELLRIVGIIHKIAKHYHANQNVSYAFTKSYTDKVIKMLDQYVDSLRDKENVSDLLDKLLAELYQTVYQIRKELRYA